MRIFAGMAALFALVVGPGAGVGRAAEWSVTEVHYQQGELETPGFAGGGRSTTRTVTVQHASGWGFGDVFCFVDLLDDDLADGFNDGDAYAELYANFSLAALRGREVSLGPVRDLGLVAGVNWGADTHVRKYLPGVRVSWDVPGFAFLNTDLTAYVDDSGGLGDGGAPAETDSYMVDVSWACPFEVAGHRMSIEGHVEYIGERTNELGRRLDGWVLGQPQFRYDLGAALLDDPDRLFVGIEWQFWINKLGDGATDESAIQALAVWRL